MKTPRRKYRKRKPKGRISFELQREDARLVALIARRANVQLNMNALDVSMDVAACHANGNRLDLKGLLSARDVDFAHDLFGIHRHLDRSTGRLKDFFVPRHTCHFDSERVFPAEEGGK
jgi:hypothetical protein